MLKIVTIFVVTMMSFVSVSQAAWKPSANWRPSTEKEAVMASKEFARCAGKFNTVKIIATVSKTTDQYNVNALSQGVQAALVASMYTLQRYVNTSAEKSKVMTKITYDSYSKSFIEEFVALSIQDKANLVANQNLFSWSNDCISLMNLQTSLIKEMNSN